MTGYELAKHFDESAGRVWHAQHPQIYTELRALERDGFVEATAAQRGTKATKRSYFLTEDGCAELVRWINEVQVPARERDAAYLKATYFEFGSLENARRHFRAHLSAYRLLEQRWRTHVDELEKRDTDLLTLRMSRAPEVAHDALVAFKVHVYQGLVKRARSEVEWAQEGLSLVDRLERSAGVPADVPLAPPSPSQNHPRAAGDA